MTKLTKRAVDALEADDKEVVDTLRKMFREMGKERWDDIIDEAILQAFDEILQSSRGKELMRKMMD